MPKPEIVESNTIKEFHHPLTECYPEVHLQKAGAALVLYINPLMPESEGAIVVANFSEKDSNLIMRALNKIDIGVKAYIKIFASTENNDIANNILSLLKNDAFSHQVKIMGLASEVAALQIETTKNDFTVQFNPRLTLVPIVGNNAASPIAKPKSSSFREAIRNAFMKSPSKRDTASARITDENIDVSLTNKPDSPPKRI